MFSDVYADLHIYGSFIWEEMRRLARAMYYDNALLSWTERSRDSALEPLDHWTRESPHLYHTDEVCNLRYLVWGT